MFQVKGESKRAGPAGGGGRQRLGRRDLDVTGLPVASSLQYGSSSLMCASQNGHLDIVKALLESRADVNAKNNVQTPLGLFASAPPLARPLTTCAPHTRARPQLARCRRRAPAHTQRRVTPVAPSESTPAARIPALACGVGRIHCADNAAALRWAWPGPSLWGAPWRARRAAVAGRA